MDLSRGIKPRPAMKPPKRVRTADQLFRICTHRRDRYRDPAFEVKLCAACRTQQVVYKSSRSKRRGARCIGDRVGVLPNGSMHPDVPASTFWWCSSPVACAQQAVHRYCLNLRPSGAECPHTRNPVGHVQGWPVPALSRQEEGQYDPHRVDWMDHLLGSTSSRRGSRGFFLQLKQITDSESLFTALQSLTGTFFSPGSPWRARAVRASWYPYGHQRRKGVN